jgi:DNA repair protein RadC
MIKVPTYQDTSEGLVVNFPVDNVRDRLLRQAEQLSSLLLLMLGTGDIGDGFHSFSDEIQHNLLWLASDLSEEVSQLADVNLIGNTEKVQISNEDLSIAAQAVATASRSKTSANKARESEPV